MMLPSPLRLRALTLTLVAITSTASHASLITLAGVGFDVVYDDQLLTLGQSAPQILGNMVVFTPSQIKAESLNGQGMLSTAATYGFTINPHEGLYVQRIDILERGDYVLRGAGSSVSLSGMASASVAGQPGATVSQALSTDASLPLIISDGLSHNWAASAVLDMSGQPAFMTQADVVFTLNTELQASTSADSSGPRRAFIQKKFSGESITLSVATTPAVPEPGLWGLGLAALGLLGMHRCVVRRRFDGGA